MNEIKIKLENCNNIKSGEISLKPKSLNIKYGINGTGKSTIASAISLQIDNEGSLQKELKPFHSFDDEEIQPSVNLPSEIRSVLVFNEEYLKQFVFTKDELLTNSYEVLIKTPEFNAYSEKIEVLLQQIKATFSEHEELDRIIDAFDRLSTSFASTKNGLSKSSPLYKGLKNGNKIENIPKELSGYTPLIQNSKCVEWLNWQLKGSDFLEISDNCPYCTSSTSDKIETIKAVSNNYDKSVIKKFLIITEALNELGDYFSPIAQESLRKITTKSSQLNPEEEQYIIEVKNQIDTLLNKLISLREISANSLDCEGNLRDQLHNLTIDLNYFDKFNSQTTQEIVTAINNSINVLLEKTNQLEAFLRIQNETLGKIIQKRQDAINSFLTSGGYRYEVIISKDEFNSYKLHLKHIESESPLTQAKQHLSFGEKNAFAIILFMYLALHENPDLIILDDPISSFDKNKKYAILHKLFRGEKGQCLKGRTVLMLTHDIDPLIDCVKILTDFQGFSHAKFIRNSSGVLSETPIKSKDLKTFAKICKDYLKSDSDIVLKVIFLRRHFEILDNLGDEYQVLSNLIHLRELGKLTVNKTEELSPERYESGVEGIVKELPEFDYNDILNALKDRGKLIQIYSKASSGYVKLNIYRILNEGKETPDVLRKFINETFHIENELICQLDPIKFDHIPEYVIEKCDADILGDSITRQTYPA